MGTVVGRADVVCKQPKVPQEGLVLQCQSPSATNYGELSLAMFKGKRLSAIRGTLQGFKGIYKTC